MSMVTNAVDMIGMASLLITFIFLSASYMHSLIDWLSVQSAAMAVGFLLMGWEVNSYSLYALAGITLMFRAFVVPYILKKDIRDDERIWRYREIKTTHHAIVLGLMMAVVAYFLYQPIYTVTGVWSGSIAFVMLFLSFLTIVTRRNALAQIVGYVSMENSLLYLAAVLSPMPLILEIGILLDVLGFALLAVVLGARKRYGPLEVEDLVG